MNENVTLDARKIVKMIVGIVLGIFIFIVPVRINGEMTVFLAFAANKRK